MSPLSLNHMNGNVSNSTSTTNETEDNSDEIARTINADSGYESPLGVSEASVNSTTDSSDSFPVASLAVGAIAVAAVGATVYGAVKQNQE